MRTLVRAAAGAALWTLAAALPVAAAESSKVTVYKSPTCGCCKLWVDHMRAAGFPVEVRDVDDVTATKQAHGLPPRLASCHTAIVDGYVVEGHVPAEDVRRLLAERPAVTGIAVPGMPMGSPGMDYGRPVPYDVIAFDDQGRLTLFSSHGPR